MALNCSRDARRLARRQRKWRVRGVNINVCIFEKNAEAIAALVNRNKWRNLYVRSGCAAEEPRRGKGAIMCRRRAAGRPKAAHGFIDLLRKKCRRVMRLASSTRNAGGMNEGEVVPNAWAISTVLQLNEAKCRAIVYVLR